MQEALLSALKYQQHVKSSIGWNKVLERITINFTGNLLEEFGAIPHIKWWLRNGDNLASDKNTLKTV